MPKVSVIMGIYNTDNREMVKLAIDSILNQTYSDFEFIICDDGSTDNTLDLVYELTSHDKRCVVIKNNNNQGLASTLNNCLKKSKGQYIARMDADDISIITRLKDEVNFLENNEKYVLVSGWADLFDNNGVYGMRKNVEFPEKKDMLFGSPFIHAAVMIRREVLEEMEGYKVEKETLRAEDYDLWMRIYTSGYKGYNIQKSLYQIREDNNAFRRRRYKYRLDEAKVRYRGFKALKLFPKGYLYVLKPLIVGLIPQRFLAILRKLR